MGGGRPANCGRRDMGFSTLFGAVLMGNQMCLQVYELIWLAKVCNTSEQKSTIGMKPMVLKNLRLKAAKIISIVAFCA